VELGKGARILLSGSREIVIAPKAYEVRADAAVNEAIEAIEGRASAPSGRRKKKGGAKSGKSG